jgi:hypothetical protein
MPFDSKTIRMATKSTPPYFKIQLKACCPLNTPLLRSLTYIKKQHRPSEYLQGYLVGSSSSIVLLDSAKVVFPRCFSACGH